MTMNTCAFPGAAKNDARDKGAWGTEMAFKKLATAALAGLISSFALAPSAQATGDLWIEGSYEHLSLPDVNFINEYNFNGGVQVDADEEFVNDNGDFNGFRLDGGIDNIAIMGGAYLMGVRGFFAWHDDKSDLECTNAPPVPGTGRFCAATPLTDDPNLQQDASLVFGSTNLYSTERDVNYWGVAVDIARAPSGLRAGPAFRRIDQDLTITGSQINNAGGIFVDPFQLIYQEDLETNYWGGFVGFDGGIDLGGGWSLQGDAEAGLYWADTDYSGNYVVTNAAIAGVGFNPNTSQTLSLDSDELAFIGIFKAALEKDFGAFRLAGFGRLEYISSAPDMAYNDLDTLAGATAMLGPDDETRIGERSAYSVSTGARITVPMGGGQ